MKINGLFGNSHLFARLPLFSLVFLLFNHSACWADNEWPQWRGPLGTGSAVDADPPITWSDTENIVWKTPIPGRGHSTPVIWNDHIFLTTAIPVGKELPRRPSTAPGNHDNLSVTHEHEFVVVCVDRNSGDLVWKKTVNRALPKEGGHYTASLASGSPVTDGKHVYAFFGSFGLFCLDFAGNVVWQKDFGPMDSKHGHGEGASPVLYENKLAVNWDHEGQSFVTVLDKSTGDPIWKKSRSEVTSWASPIVVRHGEIDQLIVCGTNRVRGYDLSNGDVIWECGGMSANIVATPVAADGILYAGSSYEKRMMLAIKLDGAKGDISDSTDNVLWRRQRGTPYVPSPLLYRDALYFLTHYQGILTRITAKSGMDAPGAMRLGGIRNVYASPVAAAGRIYITDLDGTTLVISSTEIPRMISANRMNDSFAASIAIAGKQLFLRGEKHLYCIANKD